MTRNRIALLGAQTFDRDAVMPSLDMGEAVRSIFAKLRRGWLIMAAFLCAALGVAGAYILTATPEFTANGSILIDPRVGQTPGANTPVMPGLLMSDGLTVDSELRVLTSREVTTAAVAALGLTPPEPSGPGLRQQMTAALGLDRPDPDAEPVPDTVFEARRAEALRRDFMRNMRVVRGGDSFVIDISYTSPDAVFAADAVNTLIQEYQRLSGLQNGANTERNQIWLQGRIDELRQDVEDTENEIAEFRRDNDLLAPAGQPLPNEIALNAAVDQLIRLRSEALALKVRTDRLAEQIAIGDVDAVQIPTTDRTPALTGFESRYAELQQREQELQLEWAVDSPIVQNVQRQLEQIGTLILGEYGEVLNRLQAAQVSLERQITATEAVVAELRDDYGDDVRRNVTLRSLEREADAKRDLYERLLEEYNSASQLLTFTATSARVIAYAVPPDRKSAPKSKQLLVLAIFAALVFGTTTVLLREAVDSSLRTHSDVSKGLGLRFLGVVPAFSSETGQGWFARRLKAIDVPKRSLQWEKLSKTAQQVDFAVAHPNSVSADTLRLVHGHLATFRKDHRTEKGLVLGVTSSFHGEGKTMTSSGLACFLASRGESVVLVDMDLISQALSKLLEPLLPDDLGLGALQRNLDAALDKFEGIPELSGLAVVGNRDQGQKPRSVSPRDINALEHVIAALQQRYDYVIVDLPPAQGTADTQLLSKLCDKLIFIVRWGSVPRERVISALHERGLDRAQIFGVLYTQAPVGQYRSYNRHEANSYYA